MSGDSTGGMGGFEGNTADGSSEYAPHRVVVLLVPPIVPFDTAIPGQVLNEAVDADGRRLYDVRVCTADPGQVPTGDDYTIGVSRGLDELAGAQTVIVPGTLRRSGIDPRVLDALRTAAGRARLVSICTGAFVLAEAGRLDGRPATTYWRRAAEFADRFPKVDLDPNVLYVDDGDILTSAGLAAGIDLCLHLIRRDHGAAAANAAARGVVVAPFRAGGQAQFLPTPVPRADDQSLAATRAWAAGRLDRRITLDDLAAHAHVSIRTLTRRFREQTGLSPLQWILHERVTRARELLETTGIGIEEVARLSGLGTADSLRAHLLRSIGLTPTAYRAAFRRDATVG
jgi:transcriptional regulator GlxA family with amidase domain